MRDNIHQYRSTQRGAAGLLIVAVVALVVIGGAFTYVSLSPRSDAGETVSLRPFRPNQRSSSSFDDLVDRSPRPLPSVAPVSDDDRTATIESEINATAVNGLESDFAELDALINEL